MALPVPRRAGIEPQTSASESRHPINKAISLYTHTHTHLDFFLAGAFARLAGLAERVGLPPASDRLFLLFLTRSVRRLSYVLFCLWVSPPTDRFVWFVFDSEESFSFSLVQYLILHACCGLVLVFMLMFSSCCLTRRRLFGPDGTPYVVLWRPEALDCRVDIPPETFSGLDRKPPSLGFEPQTSCI